MAKTPQPAKEPKIVLRGTQEFRHDLFKSDVQKFKKNVSWKKGVVDLVGVEHSHIFHSHDSYGDAQKYSSTIGGHFHEVKTSVDPETGELKAVCGPAMRTAVKKRASGSKRVTAPVEWFNGDADDERESRIVDDHTHTFAYVASEFLSQEKIKNVQTSTQAAVAAAMRTAGAKRVDVPDAAPAGIQEVGA